MISRAALLEMLWRAVEKNVYVSKYEYQRELFDWDITPYEIEGVLHWITVSNGPEFHFVSMGKKGAITRSRIREWLGPLLKEYGFVQTTTPVEDIRQQRFNKALGFKQTREDEFYIHYKLEHMRHA